MERPRHYRGSNEPQQQPQRPTAPPNKRIIMVNNPKQADIAKRKFPGAEIKLQEPKK